MSHSLPFVFRGATAALCGISALLGCQGLAAAEREPQTQANYQIRAELHPSSVVHASGGYRLNAALRATQSGPALHAAGRYALKASAAVSPSVCFADTIFRDGFQ